MHAVLPLFDQLHPMHRMAPESPMCSRIGALLSAAESPLAGVIQ